MLYEGEVPEHLYAGDYQSQTGYVRSRRRGAPVGMKESEWEDAHKKGGPEDLLENLIRSGYPWNTLGQRLKLIDEQFRSVSEEYSAIDDAIRQIIERIARIQERQASTVDTVRTVLREEVSAIQNRWLIGAASILLGVAGLVLATLSNQRAADFLADHGAVIGLLLIAAAVASLVLISGRQRSRD